MCNQFILVNNSEQNVTLLCLEREGEVKSRGCLDRVATMNKGGAERVLRCVVHVLILCLHRGGSTLIISCRLLIV